MDSRFFLNFKGVDAGILAGGASGLKAININQLPSDAWDIILGTASVGKIGKLYEDVPWLQRGVNLRADAVASLPFALLDSKGNEIEDPQLSFWSDIPDLLNVMEGDRTLYGRAYLAKDIRPSGLVVRRYAPQSITHKIDPRTGEITFNRKFGSQTIPLTEDDIIYSWIAQRGNFDIGPGIAPAQGALIAATTLRNIDAYASGFFERGALRVLLVSTQGGGDGEHKRLEKWFNKVATGVKNAFRAIAVRGELKVTEIGHSPKDLAMDVLSAQKREDIVTALGIPMTMLLSTSAKGLGGGGVREQDSLDFYNNTIIPEADKIEATLNDQLFNDLGFKFTFKPEELEIYQAQEAKKAEKLALLFDRNIIDTNEVRLQMGYDAREVEQALPLELPETTTEPMTIEGTARNRTPFERDVRKWARVASKRYREGSPQKALAFESDVIPSPLAGAIKGSLESVKTPEEAHGVVMSALSWEGYP